MDPPASAPSSARAGPASRSRSGIAFQGTSGIPPARNLSRLVSARPKGGPLQLPPLRAATYEQRLNRFTARLRSADGEPLLAHLPNSGSLRGLDRPDARAWLSRASNPRRKLPWTLELIEGGTPPRPVLVNTWRHNALLREALEARRVPGLEGYAEVLPERRLGASRLDFLLRGPGLPELWLEVKSVTWAEGGLALFPDAPTARGRRHLDELLAARRTGARALLLFAVGREDARALAPAREVDPAWTRRLVEVAGEGVELLALGLRVEPPRLGLGEPLPVLLHARGGGGAGGREAR